MFSLVDSKGVDNIGFRREFDPGGWGESSTEWWEEAVKNPMIYRNEQKEKEKNEKRLDLEAAIQFHVAYRSK